MESSFKSTGGFNDSQKKIIPITGDDGQTSFRIRGSANGGSRVPTVYGMPKVKQLPKIDNQFAKMMLNDDQDDHNDQIEKPMVASSTLKTILKRRQLHAKDPQPLLHEKAIQEVQQQIHPPQDFDFPDKEEKKHDQEEVKHHSRISTAKSTLSSTSTHSLSHTASETSLIIDPNSIIDDNSVLAQLVKTNVQLLQKCLVSSNKSIFIAAIENLKSASMNFGPALNKHLPIVLQLIKKKQDLVATERLHELKRVLVECGGDQAQDIVDKVGLK